MDKSQIRPTTSHLAHSLATMGISSGSFVTAIYVLNVLPTTPVTSVVEFDEKWHNVWAKQARVLIEGAAETAIVDRALALEWVRRGQRFRTHRYQLASIVYDYVPINDFMRAQWPDMNNDPRVEYVYQVMNKFIDALFSHRDDIQGMIMAGMGNPRTRGEVAASIVDGFMEALYEREGSIPKHMVDFTRKAMISYMWHMFVSLLEVHKAQILSEDAPGFSNLIKAMGFNENELSTLLKAISDNGGIFEGDKEKPYV